MTLYSTLPCSHGGEAQLPTFFGFHAHDALEPGRLSDARIHGLCWLECSWARLWRGLVLIVCCPASALLGIRHCCF